MILNKTGQILKSHILKIPEYNTRAILDEWVIMPNHIHLLICLGNHDYRNGIYPENNDCCSEIINETIDAENIHKTIDVEKIHEFSLHIHDDSADVRNRSNNIIEYRKKRRQMIILKIIRKLKMLTTKQIHVDCATSDEIWQSNYHDTIIRNEIQHQRIKLYIKNNPIDWKI